MSYVLCGIKLNVPTKKIKNCDIKIFKHTIEIKSISISLNHYMATSAAVKKKGIPSTVDLHGHPRIFPITKMAVYGHCRISVTPVQDPP